jgi:hypothetical protein
MKTHFVITADGQLACSSPSYVAMATSGRDVCTTCERRIDDIVYTATRLAKAAGAQAQAAGDKRMLRTLKYLRSLDAEDAEVAHCQCGVWSRVRCEHTGAADDLVTVEWMPEDRRVSHTAAGNRGVYPHNGAIRLRVTHACAAAICAEAGDWATRL